MSEPHQINNENQTSSIILPPEFTSHIINLHHSTKKKILDLFKGDFSKFFLKLKKLYDSWRGKIDPEYIYLLVKTGVLFGYFNQIKTLENDIKHFYGHPGIMAWFAGSFKREGPSGKNKALFYLSEIDEGNLQAGTELWTEIIGWKIFYGNFETALGLFEDSKKKFVETMPYWLILDKLLRMNRLKLAETYLGDAFRITKNRFYQSRFYNVRGIIERLKGHIHESFDYYFLGLEEICAKNGLEDTYYQAQIFFNLATSAKYIQDYSEAENYLFKSLNIYRNNQLGTLTEFGKIYLSLSSIYIDTGNYKAGLKHLTQAEDIKRKFDPNFNDPVTISTLTKKGYLYQQLGEYKLAKKILIEADEKFTQLKGNCSPVPLIEAKINLIVLDLLMGDTLDLTQKLYDLLNLAYSNDYIIGAGRILNILAYYFIQNAELEEAHNSISEAKAIFSKLSLEDKKVDTYINEVRLLILQGKTIEARAILTAILKNNAQHEFSNETDILYLLGYLNYYLGNINLSNKFFLKTITLFNNKKTNAYYLSKIMLIKTEILNTPDLEAKREKILMNIEAINKILEENLTKTIFVEIHFLKAWLFEEIHDYSIAQTIYENMVAILPNDKRMYLLRSISLLKNKILYILMQTELISSNTVFSMSNELFSEISLSINILEHDIKVSGHFLYSMELDLLKICLSVISGDSGRIQLLFKKFQEKVHLHGLYVYNDVINFIQKIISKKTDIQPYLINRILTPIVKNSTQMISLISQTS